MAYNGWMLPDSERARVLGAFPPKYDAAKASHVTLSIDSKVIPIDVDIVIVGYADDGEGMEVLVCTVDGDLDRPDGGTFHLTLSHAMHRAAKEANDVVQQGGWEPVQRFPIKTRAFLCRGGNYITTPLSGAEL